MRPRHLYILLDISIRHGGARRMDCPGIARFRIFAALQAGNSREQTPA
jgi:hypothetical protein